MGELSAKNMEDLKVDVIIPTYRPGQEFEKLLEQLNRQTLPPEKIVIMNTEEEFWRPEWEERYPLLEVHHLKKQEFDHGGTRSAAAKLCRGDILVYMTQDALPEGGELLENLIRPILEGEKVAGSYARQLPRRDCGILEQYTRNFNYPARSCIKRAEDLEHYGIKTFFCSNVCAAYVRRVYEELGGFPERAIFNEDMIYAEAMIRHGYGVAYAAEAQVFHSHNYSCLRQFCRNFDMGVSQAQHPEVFQNVPSEGEGIRLVKDTAAYLVRRGCFWLLPVLFLQSAAKYAGYLAGKNYRSLPPSLVLRFTMNREYWKREQSGSGAGVFR